LILSFVVTNEEVKSFVSGSLPRSVRGTHGMYGTRCGATQISLILPFWPKSATATKINIIFETLLMRFHFYHQSVALLLNEAAIAQTYWQAPFTGDGAREKFQKDCGYRFYLWVHLWLGTDCA
jgi:hypothetical protein